MGVGDVGLRGMDVVDKGVFVSYVDGLVGECCGGGMVGFGIWVWVEWLSLVSLVARGD